MPILTIRKLGHQRRLVILTSFLLGALSPVVSQRLQGGIEFNTLWIPIVLIGAVSSFSVWRCQLGIARVAMTVGIGIVAGLLADSTMDYFFFSRDRTLFGIEVMFWLMTLICPALLAMGVTRLIKNQSR